MENENKPSINIEKEILLIKQKLDILISMAMKYNSIIQVNQSKCDERKLSKAE